MTYLNTETVVENGKKIRRDVFLNDRTDELVYIIISVEEVM